MLGCALVFFAALLAGRASLAQDTGIVKEVEKLLKAKVGDDVIVSYIENKGRPATLSAEEIIELKAAGATDPVLVALLGGKRPGGFPFNLDEQHEVLAPVVQGPLAVYPILRKGPASVGTYLTLDEATERKIVMIAEKEGGEVPVVIIRNTGTLPVYLSAGEVIIGGKQDRMIAHDVLIEAGKELTVEVRCVEHGRWSGASDLFLSGKALGGGKARFSVQFKGQGDVWADVATQNAAVGAQPSSGTYNAALTNPEVEAKYQEYARAMMPKLEGRNTVGTVVAINGKVQSVDIFASPSLFQKMKDKLLKAVVLDVIGVKDAGAAEPGKDAILDFYKSTMAAQAVELKRYGDNCNFKRESGAAAANESLDTGGQMLHRSLQAK